MAMDNVDNGGGFHPESKKVEFKRFSPESRRALESKGYVVVSATGDLMSQKAKGWSIQSLSNWESRFPHLLSVPSMESEVAFDPKNLFIEGSESKTMDEQLKMVKDFSINLQREIPGVEAVVGEAPDYVSAVFDYLEHHEDEAEELQGALRNWTRTVTNITGDEFVNIGSFTSEQFEVNVVTMDSVGSRETSGLSLDHENSHEGDSMIGVIPLIKPL